MSRVMYEVAPAASGWVIRMPGDSESEMVGDKATAVRRARQLAARYGEWQIRVLDANGKLDTEYRSHAASPH
jgi:hypothetical protein